MVDGKLQREGEVTHVIVKHCYNISGLLQQLGPGDESPDVLTLSRADENSGEVFQTTNKKTQVRKVIQTELFPEGRNFK